MRKVEWHAYFSGRVQGVFFRASIKYIARKFAIFGSASNLSDGRVEVILQGPKENISSCISKIGKNLGLARIDSVESEYRKVESELTSFETF